MQVLSKTKIGPFLVISSVLTVWTLLAIQPVQAHVYNSAGTPGCSNLPTAADFFGTTGSPVATASITAADADVSVSTKAGATAANSGNTRYVYAKITIPALAAGELRVFDSRNSGGSDVSAASLCRRGSSIASFSKGYSSSKHPTSDAAHSADTAEHETFQIRVPVSPGDEEYIVVIDSEETPGTGVQATTPGTIAVAFHGAIESTAPLLGRQGALDAGEVESRTIAITAPGLLTLETTGSTDTVGTFGNNPEVESGGSSGNFKMVLPVEVSTGATLLVEGQTPSTTGSYTLNMDFEVAMNNAANDLGTPADNSVINVADRPTWTGTAIATDDTTLQIDGRSDADYFVFDVADDLMGFLTIEATNATGATQHSDTAGTLYGPNGQIATASSGGGGNHFKFRVPVVEMTPYLVKVTGSTGMYALSFTFDSATLQGTSASTPDATATLDCPDSATTNDPHEICARGTRLQQERDRYQITVTEPGTLYVHTTGATDTVGTLYGPDGGQIATDDNGGQGNNFRIAARVNPGLHIVEVRGQTADTQGVYGLVTNFIAGDGGPVTPGTGDGNVERLQAEVTRLQNELNACREPVATNATGELENPSGGGYRSGIGLISGWVCAAEEVEVRIFNVRGVRIRTLNVAYGTIRPDVPLSGRCTNPNAGFGMTYNFNLLPEGMYTIRAYADGTDNQIGTDQTFEVVHLTAFEATDEDRFLRLPDDVQARGECVVKDFPAAGEDTYLKWEQSIQNFVIEDAG